MLIYASLHCVSHKSTACPSTISAQNAGKSNCSVALCIFSSATKHGHSFIILKYHIYPIKRPWGPLHFSEGAFIRAPIIQLFTDIFFTLSALKTVIHFQTFHPNIVYPQDLSFNFVSFVHNVCRTHRSLHGHANLAYSM